MKDWKPGNAPEVDERKECSFGKDRTGNMESLAAMPERRPPHLSDLKRALRWLRAQYQTRARKPPPAKNA